MGKRKDKEGSELSVDLILKIVDGTISSRKIDCKPELVVNNLFVNTALSYSITFSSIKHLFVVALLC